MKTMPVRSGGHVSVRTGLEAFERSRDHSQAPSARSLDLVTLDSMERPARGRSVRSARESG